MKIKIIPYEDKKKYCTGFYLVSGNQSDDSIRKQLLQRGSNELNFAEIKELIKVLDEINMPKLKNSEIVIQMGEVNLEVS